MPAFTKFVVPGILAFTVFMSFIEMIIAAVLVSSYNRSDYPSTQIKNVTRFALFVSIFNIVFGLAMGYATLKLATSIIASIAGLAAFTFILWIFWLATGASLEDALGGAFSCSNEAFAHCHQLRALEAFAWINFIVLVITFLAIIYLGVRATRKGEGFTGALSA